VLLEGAQKRLGIVEADDWRKKEAKETREALRAQGKIPLLARQAAQVLAMAEAARAYVAQSELAGIFERGRPEVSLRWREGDVRCKGRLDWLTDDDTLIVDYKSTGNAEPTAFGERLAPIMGYDLQAAFYLRGVSVALGKPRPRFVWLVQEIEPPYICSLVAMSPQMEEYAERKRGMAVAMWQSCMQRNTWHGYPQRIAYVDLPAYQAARVDELLEMGTL